MFKMMAFGLALSLGLLCSSSTAVCAPTVESVDFVKDKSLSGIKDSLIEVFSKDKEVKKFVLDSISKNKKDFKKSFPGILNKFKIYIEKKLKNMEQEQKELVDVEKNDRIKKEYFSYVKKIADSKKSKKESEKVMKNAENYDSNLFKRFARNKENSLNRHIKNLKSVLYYVNLYEKDSKFKKEVASYLDNVDMDEVYKEIYDRYLKKKNARI